MLVLAMQFSRGNDETPASRRHPSIQKEGCRPRPVSAFLGVRDKAPWPTWSASGPWGHSLETEERTNGLHLEPRGDPRIYNQRAELQDE